MNTQQFIEVAPTYYAVGGGDRWYHNWAHAYRVAGTVTEMTKNQASDALVIAAWWHDAVYFPGAGADANERCSSAALGLEARRLDFFNPLSKEEKDAVNDAQVLIQHTCIEDHLHPNRIAGDLAVLLDADLSSLADLYDKFLESQQNIIKEMGGTWPESQPESAAFLKNFLECRDFIYHTDYGREHWEAAARANIEKYLKG